MGGGGGGDGGGRVPHGKINLAKVKRSSGIYFKDLTERVQIAGWWALPVYDRTSTQRRELQGEIHIPATAHATAHFGRYNYFVRHFAQLSVWVIRRTG